MRRVRVGLTCHAAVTMIGRMDGATPRAYTTGTVASADGTTIGYRRMGDGPGVVLIHGGMQGAQNFMALAAALRDAFTVYVPDRRGRGLSGPHGDGYCLDRECEDLDALLAETGARDVFGLSSGALIALQAALVLPRVRKAALYEPPLITERSKPTSWAARYERELAAERLAEAMVTVIKGTGDSSPFALVPRFVLVPLMRQAIRNRAGQVRGDDVPIGALVPTLHFDLKLVEETRGALEGFRAVRPAVLLLGGSRSARFLRTALDELQTVLPGAKRVELAGLGHVAADNSGKPEVVADALRSFFASP